MKGYRNPVEKFACRVREEGLSEMTVVALLDLISLAEDERNLKTLVEKREWLRPAALEELSRLEECRFIEGKPSEVSINWKELRLDLLERDLSPRKPLSATLTLQTAFRRRQQPPSAGKPLSQGSDLATFRHASRFLTKNGAESRSEALVGEYFQWVSRLTAGIATPTGFLSWLQRKFTPKSK